MRREFPDGEFHIKVSDPSKKERGLSADIPPYEETLGGWTNRADGARWLRYNFGGLTTPHFGRLELDHPDSLTLNRIDEIGDHRTYCFVCNVT